MSPEGKFLAATTHDGRVNVYDTTKINEEVTAAQTLAQFETKGSFGTCVDIVRSHYGTSNLLQPLLMITASSHRTAK
jgi:hypothetical protein